MVEVRTAILAIIGVTLTVGMVVIFMGCNESFAYEDLTFEETCEGYSTVRPANTMYSPFEKCTIKQESRTNLCSDYFWWTRI